MLIAWLLGTGLWAWSYGLDGLQEMDGTRNARDDAAEKGVGKRATPPGALVADARWILAKKKRSRISTLVLIYPLPALRRTAIQLAWDLTDYPGAWPATE
jgi:hypothetical protein